jgi:hypothetical protein
MTHVLFRCVNLFLGGLPDVSLQPPTFLQFAIRPVTVTVLYEALNYAF